MSKPGTRQVLTALAAFVLVAAPAAAGSRIERDLDLGSGGRLRLEADVGSVLVVGDSGTTGRLVVTSRTDDLEDRFDLSVSRDAGSVTIRFEKKAGARGSGWFGWRRDGNVRFELEVPPATELDIDTAGGSISAQRIDAPVRLDTSGGSIDVRQIRGNVLADTSGGSIEVEEVDGDVDADTSGGSITVQQVRGQVRADTSGGSIEIEGADGDVVADTSGGSIRVEGAAGRVDADTSGGTVRVSFAPGNASGGSLSTSGGGIEVRVDESAGLDVDASAEEIIADIPMTVRGKVSKTSLQGQIGGGGATLRLRASGGKIRIKPL